MQTLNLDIFNAFARDWALLSAGSLDHFNTMTISWGGLGTLWGKSVATVYVRPCRHTYEYMENSEYFTVSFFSDLYREDLKILGTLSGRDGDKVAKTSLTPVAAGSGVSFSQAHTTLLCKKLYAQDMDPRAIPADLLEKMYGGETPHRIYIGEVVDIIK